jgi:hypothetical protein
VAAKDPHPKFNCLKKSLRLAWMTMDGARESKAAKLSHAAFALVSFAL